MEFQSSEIDKIAEALALAQGEFSPAEKNATNPHLKNKYADLGEVWKAVREVLPAHGLSVVQTMRQTEDGRAAVHTMLLHKSGQWIAGLCALPVPKNDPQGFGSAYTYARRYSLSAMLGVVSEDDDDGEGAKGKKGQQASKERPYDLTGIERRLKELRDEGQMTQYMKSLAIPKEHSQRPAIERIYNEAVKRARQDAPPAGPKPITDEQRKYIQASYGHMDRDRRLAIISEFIGRTIESVNDMTKDEASGLIDVLENEKKEAARA